MKQLFIDIETTGLNPISDNLREIGFIYRVDGYIEDQGLITSNFYREFTTKMNSFVNKFDKKDKMYFFGYNGSFDSEFIRQMFIKNNDKFYGSYFYTPIIDIMQVCAYKLMGNGLRPENFKLGTMAKFLKIKVDESKLHEALYDVTLAKDVYNKIVKY